ncbi:MAG: sugar phosphate nucleotidyltransferase [Patescibacteria group bacterium]
MEQHNTQGVPVDTAVIMAAGRGTRMKELTATTPKPLLPVEGRPFLLYALERLAAAGFTRVVVVTGHMREQFDVVLQQTPSGLEVQTVNQYAVTPENHYGTAMAILAAEAATKGETFIALAGDQLYSLSDLQRIRHFDEELHVMSVISSDHPKDFGIAVLGENNMLQEIAEKSENPPGNLANMSLYRFLPEIFDTIKQVKESERGEYELTDAITILAGKKKVKVMELAEPCLHLSNPDDMNTAREFVQNGDNKVRPHS